MVALVILVFYGLLVLLVAEEGYTLGIVTVGTILVLGRRVFRAAAVRRCVFLCAG